MCAKEKIIFDISVTKYFRAGRLLDFSKHNLVFLVCNVFLKLHLIIFTVILVKTLKPFSFFALRRLCRAKTLAYK